MNIIKRARRRLRNAHSLLLLQARWRYSELDYWREMANSQSAGGTATNIKVAVRCRPFIGVCRTVQLRECWNPRPLQLRECWNP